jgi:Icc-related predicted phosphoesterase
MRFIASSDVHNLWSELEVYLQPADVLILAGDLTNGSEADFRYFLSWIKDQQYDHKIVIGGNWDRCFDNVKKSVFAEVGVTYLLHEEHSITVGSHRVKIFGSPYTQLYSRMAFEETEQELRQLYKAIPQDLDILLTHGPPKGILDRNRQKVSCGSSALLEAIEQKVPRVHVFGHVHEGYGIHISKLGQVFLNVAGAGQSRYGETQFNPPIVFDLLEDGSGIVENTGHSFTLKT